MDESSQQEGSMCSPFSRTPMVRPGVPGQTDVGDGGDGADVPPDIAPSALLFWIAGVIVLVILLTTVLGSILTFPRNTRGQGCLSAFTQQETQDAFRRTTVVRESISV